MTATAAELRMSQAMLDALKECAAAAYPLECCGLLVGHQVAPAAPTGCVVKRVSRVVPTANRATAPERAFEVDPAAHIALLRALREQSTWDGDAGEQVIGHYHSHPDTPAVPSARDRAQAADPDAVWLIVAANRAGAGEARAWQATNGGDGAITLLPMGLVIAGD
jgi:proteasome lid subunit RPN8/RPN11